MPLELTVSSGGDFVGAGARPLFCSSVVPVRRERSLRSVDFVGNAPV